MEITSVTPAVCTAKVRTTKTAVPKSSSKAARPAAVKPESLTAAPKRKLLAKKQATPATAATANSTDMIATAAYYLAEQRQFAPGDELQDWLAAERLILGGSRSN